MKKLLSLIGLLSICLQESTMKAMESQDASPQPAPQLVPPAVPGQAAATQPGAPQLPAGTNRVSVNMVTIITLHQTLAPIQNVLAQLPKAHQGASQAAIAMINMAQAGLAQPADPQLQAAQVIQLQRNDLATITQALALAQQAIAQGSQAQPSAIQQAQAALRQAHTLLRPALAPLFPPTAQQVQNQGAQAQQVPQQAGVQPAAQPGQQRPIAGIAQPQPQPLRAQQAVPGGGLQVAAHQGNVNPFAQNPPLQPLPARGYFLAPLDHPERLGAGSAFAMSRASQPWYEKKKIIHRAHCKTTQADFEKAVAEKQFDAVLDTMFALAQDPRMIPFAKWLQKVTPLFYAIQQKNLALVQFLDPLEFWYGDERPREAYVHDLQVPQAERQLESFDALSGAKLRSLSPLEYAIATDASEIAAWMMNSGNPKHLTPYGLQKALLKAIQHNKLIFAEALLEKLSRLEAPPHLGLGLGPDDQKNHLHFAQSADAVKLLIRHGFDKERALPGEYPSRFDIGQKFQRTQFSNGLGGQGHTVVKIDKVMTPLHTAVNKENLEVVKALIEAGALVDDKSYKLSSLHIAAMKGNSAIIDVLVKAGASKNKKDSAGFTALDYALIFDHKDAIETLHRAGHSVMKNTCALHIAVKENRFDLVQFFIDNHVNLNYRGAADAPPIYYAKNVEMLDLLVRHGAKFDKSLISKYLSAHRLQNMYGMINYVIDHGGDKTLGNPNRATALHKAIRLKDLRLTKLFIEHGADVNAKPKGYALPLISAINHPILQRITRRKYKSDNAMLKLLLGHPLLKIPADLTTRANPKAIKRLGSLLDFAVNWQKYIAAKSWMRISKNGETPLLLAAVCNNSEALKEFFTNQLALVPARYSMLAKEKQGPHFENKETDLFKPQARYYINAHDKNGLSALMYLARYSHNVHFINSLLPYSVYAINAGTKLYTEEVLKAAQEAASCGNYRIACALLNACIHDVSSIFFGEEVPSTPQIEEVAESEIEEKVAAQ